MWLLVLAVISSIAALFANAVATRKNRNADMWTVATAVVAPTLLVLLVLPEISEDLAEAATLEGRV